MKSYAEGALLVQVKDRVDGELRDDLAILKPEEAAVLTLLELRLGRDLTTARARPSPVLRREGTRHPSSAPPLAG